MQQNQLDDITMSVNSQGYEIKIPNFFKPLRLVVSKLILALTARGLSVQPSLTPDDPSNLNYDEPETFLAARNNDNLAIMTVHTEILKRILALRDNQDHLIHPRILTKLAIRYLVKREKNMLVKEQLKTLLSDD